MEPVGGICCILCNVKVATNKAAYEHYKHTIHQHRMQLDKSAVDGYLVPCEKLPCGTILPHDFTFTHIDVIPSADTILYQYAKSRKDSNFDWDLEKRIKVTIDAKAKEKEWIINRIRSNNEIREITQIVAKESEEEFISTVEKKSEEEFIDNIAKKQDHELELMENIQTEWLLKETDPELKKNYLTEYDLFEDLIEPESESEDESNE
jgi:hypothetical protein